MINLNVNELISQDCVEKPLLIIIVIKLLKNSTKRPEMVVGWYHSHPGFGCWLSGVDINTQQSFEALTERAVAVVVDPIQSVKGKVVIDAFRLINPNTMVLGHEPRQTTSNLGHLQKPSIQVNQKTNASKSLNSKINLNFESRRLFTV